MLLTREEKRLGDVFSICVIQTQGIAVRLSGIELIDRLGAEQLFCNHLIHDRFDLLTEFDSFVVALR